MTKKKNKLTTALKSGKKTIHGGYSYLTTGRLPEHRRYIEQYLTAARMNLIKDLGPTEQDLTAAQIIIIDRVISILGVLRCLEEHTRENSVMVGKGELAPALRSSYLAFNNSLRLNLQALGINVKQTDSVPGPLEYIEEFDKSKKRTKK